MYIQTNGLESDMYSNIHSDSVESSRMPKIGTLIKSAAYDYYPLRSSWGPAKSPLHVLTGTNVSMSNQHYGIPGYLSTNQGSQARFQRG